jgi:hypothetical protein
MAFILVPDVLESFQTLGLEVCWVQNIWSMIFEGLKLEG